METLKKNWTKTPIGWMHKQEPTELSPAKQWFKPIFEPEKFLPDEVEIEEQDPIPDQNSVDLRKTEVQAQKKAGMRKGRQSTIMSAALGGSGKLG